MNRMQLTDLAKAGVVTVALVGSLTVGNPARATSGPPVSSAGESTPAAQSKSVNGGSSDASSNVTVACGSRPGDVDRRSYGTLFAFDGVNMRSGPYTSCTILGRGYLPNRLDYHCYALGQEVNGYSTWTYLRNVTTGKYGWVNDGLLDANSDGTRGSLVYC